MALLLRRGLESDRLSITPEEGELIYVTDTKLIYIGDGVTPGGILVASGGTSSPSLSLAVSNVTVGEGTSVTFTLTTVGISNGTSVPYTVTGVTSDDIDGVSLTGNFIVISSTSDVTFNITADLTTEGPETLTLTLDGYPSVTASVTITDDSITPSSLDGGSPGTITFDSTVDGGSSSTSSFDTIIDGGTP